MSLTTSKPRRPKPVTGKTAPNAIHLMLGVLADCKRSIESLRHEIKDSWIDMEELQRRIDNAFYDLEELDADKYRKGSMHDQQSHT